MQRAHPQKLAVREREVLALMLRKQGGSYRQIAAQLRQREGISPKYNTNAAYLDVLHALG